MPERPTDPLYQRVKGLGPVQHIPLNSPERVSLKINPETTKGFFKQMLGCAIVGAISLGICGSIYWIANQIGP